MTKKTFKPKIKQQGNRSEATKKYKDPTGYPATSIPPQNSGYDEKQPLEKKMKNTH